MLVAGRVRVDKQGDVEVTTLYSANTVSAIIANWMKPARAALLATLAAFTLAGCESGTSILGGGQSAGPATALTSPSTTSGTSQTAKLEIAPVIGAPENISHDLQAQLTSSIERNQISVARAPGGRGGPV